MLRELESKLHVQKMYGLIGFFIFCFFGARNTVLGSKKRYLGSCYIMELYVAAGREAEKEDEEKVNKKNPRTSAHALKVINVLSIVMTMT